MKLSKLPNGTKRTISGVISITTVFLQSKHIIDEDTAIFIGSLSLVLLAVGVGHAVRKSGK